MRIEKIKTKFVKKVFPKLIGGAINIVSYYSPLKAAMLSMHLFSTPRGGRMLPFQKAYLDKADEQLVLMYEDENIQTYHWKGSGKKILLMHGWESNSWRWRKLIKVLREYDYDIMAMDAPAHGLTGSKIFNADLYAKMANVAVDHFKPEIVIGHSVGGMAVLFHGHTYKDTSIKQRIILAAPDKWLDLAEKFHGILGLNNRVIGSLEKAFQSYFPQPQSYYNCSDFVVNLDGTGLLIHDEDDLINESKEGQKISENWVNSKFIKTKGFGHALQNREVFDIICQFIERNNEEA